MYLDLPQLPGALHPAGHVHRVAPDVVLRFPRPDHSGYHRAMINAWEKKNMVLLLKNPSDLTDIHGQANIQKRRVERQKGTLLFC